MSHTDHSPGGPGPKGHQAGAPTTEEELEFHLELLVERLCGEGYTRAEAEAEARRRFGDLDSLSDECAVARGGPAALALERLVRATTSGGWCFLLLLLLPLIGSDMGGVFKLHWLLVIGVAFSGPLLAAAWDPRRRGSLAARLGPALTLGGIALVGLSPSILTAFHPTAIDVSAVPPVTVGDLGEGGAGLLDLDPFRPLAEVALFGLGGPVPRLMDPQLRDSPREQVERGLAYGPHWLKVCLGALFDAALLWLSLAGVVWLALRSPQAPGNSPALPGLAALPSLHMAQDVGLVESIYGSVLRPYLAVGGVLLLYLAPAASALVQLLRARRRWSRGAQTPDQLLRLRLQRLRCYPLLLLLLSPLLLFAASAASESNPPFTRAVGPVLVLAALAGAWLLRTGRRAGRDDSTGW